MVQHRRVALLSSFWGVLFAPVCYAQLSVQTVVGNTVGSFGTNQREFMVHEQRDSDNFRFSLTTDSKQVNTDQIQTVDGNQVRTVESFQVDSGAWLIEQGTQSTITNVHILDSYDYADFSTTNSVSTSY